MQAVAGKLKKKTDITAEKIVKDEPLEFGRMQDEDEEEHAAARLPGEEVWEREALISTKSESLPAAEAAPTVAAPNRSLARQVERGLTLCSQRKAGCDFHT